MRAPTVEISRLEKTSIMEISVKVTKVWHIRTWIASRLIMLAVIVLGATPKVEISEE